MRLKLIERLEALEERMPQPGNPQKAYLPEWLMEAALEQGIHLPSAATSFAARRRCEPRVAPGVDNILPELAQPTFAGVSQTNNDGKVEFAKSSTESNWCHDTRHSS